jgi:hypothetical protein
VRVPGQATRTGTSAVIGSRIAGLDIEANQA